VLKITKPGIYRGVTEADYRADPTPTPSLTQSAVKILLERSPKHAWTGNQRLNPQFEPDDDPKFDVGNAAHRLVLGRGKDFEIVQASDWRSKAAKDAREAAAEQGKIGILQDQFEQACQMNLALTQQLAKHEDSDAFTDGDAEVMIAWEENGVWFRALIDWLHTDLCTVDDYKSSGMSMASHVLGMRAEAAGWHIQAAFIERGLDILDPRNAGRRLFRFVGQETAKPHAINVMHMNEYWLTMGRKKVETGAAIWRACIASNNWPAYPRYPVTPEFPGFKEKQWLDRELSGEFEQDTKLIMAG
jgi:hypothetical protein